MVKKEKDIFVLVMSVVLGFALIGTFFGIGYMLGKNLPSSTIEPVVVDLEADDPFLGHVDAPVTLVEFSDFECSFCARHYLQSHKQLVEEYINTGKVKFVYKDFPLSIHRNATVAAMSAECAYDQGGNEMYFAMHDLIFDKQLDGVGSPTKENLLVWASEIEGLDVPVLQSCIDNNETLWRVNRDLDQGTSLGVSATPTFFINGKKLEGALPYSVIKAAIDVELAKQK